MSGELETAMLQTKVGDEQRERLLSELDEVLRLTKIVDGLTLLTKADAGQITLDFESWCNWMSWCGIVLRTRKFCPSARCAGLSWESGAGEFDGGPAPVTAVVVEPFGQCGEV